MNFREKEELHLGKTYEFTVIVRHNSNKHVGTLSLSPEKIALKITGESDEHRNFNIGFKNIAFMECSEFNNNFILFNLTIMSFSDGVIDHQQKRYFHEYTFDVQYLIQSDEILNQRSTFNTICLHSFDIQRWIGHTHKQYELINSYSSRNSSCDISDVDSNEFSLNIENLGELSLHYNWVIFGVLDKFATGMQFPPSINMYLDEDTSFENAFALQRIIHEIFSFLFGKMVAIDKILLSSQQRANCSLYYPINLLPAFSSNDYALFPLSRNLQHDTLYLPELPLEVFNVFFNSKRKSFIGKYLKYRSMQNIEERFLGYFRLLESLCYQKAYYVDEALLARINRLNSSKYNTERCIALFLDRLPKSLTDDFRFTKKDLGKYVRQGMTSHMPTKWSLTKMSYLDLKNL